MPEKNNDEMNFIFNLALAIYGVSLNFSPYQAHAAGIFRPADIIIYWKLDNLLATMLYGLLLLITLFGFVLCWYHRNKLWEELNCFGAQSRITKIIHVVFALILGGSPWLVYYAMYTLRVRGLI